MALAARKMNIALPAGLKIDAEVDLNIAEGVYFLIARINVSVPGLDPARAHSLIDMAHQTCPYSRATRNNVDVQINLV